MRIVGVSVGYQPAPNIFPLAKESAPLLKVKCCGTCRTFLKVLVHTIDVWHMQPPKFVEDNQATRALNWEDYKTTWDRLEKYCGLKRKTSLQKMAMFMEQKHDGIFSILILKGL